MELRAYIKKTTSLIPKSLKILSSLELDSIKYDFAKGSDEYPKTIKEAVNKIKKLWRRKL